MIEEIKESGKSYPSVGKVWRVQAEADEIVVVVNAVTEHSPPVTVDVEVVQTWVN